MPPFRTPLELENASALVSSRLRWRRDIGAYGVARDLGYSPLEADQIATRVEAQGERPWEVSDAD